MLQVFYGREDELERIRTHMLSDCEKPMVLYGEGGCGKTSLLAKSAGLASTEWFQGSKPISIIRFLGTTPDSSALTPTLVSICQQVGDEVPRNLFLDTDCIFNVFMAEITSHKLCYCL